MSDETCGQCKFFQRRPDQYMDFTYCGWKPPRVPGLRPWAQNVSMTGENEEACSVFVSALDIPAPAETKTRKIEL